MELFSTVCIGNTGSILDGRQGVLIGVVSELPGMKIWIVYLDKPEPTYGYLGVPIPESCLFVLQ